MITTTMKGMIINTNGIALALIGGTLVGCAASPSPLGEWSDRPLSERVRAYHATGDASPMVEGDVVGGREPRAERPATLVDLAVKSNAELRVARQRIEKLRERIAQASGLPDPMASLTVGELAETAAGQVDFIIAVSQTLPYPGTLDARSEVARRQVVEALSEYESLLNRITSDLHRAWWSHYAATRQAEVLAQNARLLEQIRESVEVQLRVGRASQADLLRVARRIAALENRLATLRQRQRSAAAMIGQLIGEPGATITTAEIDITPPGEPDRAMLVRRAATTNPAVRVAQARASTERARLALARRERLPDFKVGLQYGAVGSAGLSPVANGDDQFAVTLGVTVPIWSEKYDAAEREAWRGMGEALAGVRAAFERAVFETDDALARIEASRDSLQRLRDRMMPDARQTIKVALTAYQNNQTDLLQLLDDWQALLDDQVTEARLVADLHRAVADLDQAAGGRATLPDTSAEGNP